MTLRWHEPERSADALSSNYLKISIDAPEYSIESIAGSHCDWNHLGRAIWHGSFLSLRNVDILKNLHGEGEWNRRPLRFEYHLGYRIVVGMSQT